jgi:hypothetical protein
MAEGRWGCRLIGRSLLLSDGVLPGSRIPPILPVDLIARLIDATLPLPQGLGRPPLPTVEVVETLRFFLREGGTENIIAFAFVGNIKGYGVIREI